MFCEKPKENKTGGKQRERAAHAVLLHFYLPENKVPAPTEKTVGSAEGVLSSTGRSNRQNPAYRRPVLPDQQECPHVIENIPHAAVEGAPIALEPDKIGE
jgi:hypothetical protein